MNLISKKIIVTLVFLLLPLYSSAEPGPNNKLTCSATHLDTDKLVDVKTVSSIGGHKVATAQWPLGYPTIAINHSVFLKLPTNAKQFIFYHECAHLMFRSEDEQAMDCESINLLITQHDYAEIDVRKLIQNLNKELGWSKRWHKLLDCKGL